MYNNLLDFLLYMNEPLGAKGPLLVGEEVHKEEVGKVGS